MNLLSNMPYSEAVEIISMVVETKARQHDAKAKDCIEQDLNTEVYSDRVKADLHKDDARRLRIAMQVVMRGY